MGRSRFPVIVAAQRDERSAPVRYTARIRGAFLAVAFRSGSQIRATHPMPDPTRVKLSALTGLRFVAAMHVVLFHEAQWVFSDLATFVQTHGWFRLAAGDLAADKVSEWVRHLGASGMSSVSLFFVLSGFILAYNYRETLGRNISIVEYYRLRFARIYPVYLVGLLLTLPFVVHRVRIGVEPIDDAARRGLLNIALAQSWYPPDALSWNGPGWSLSVEMFFYAIFPLALRHIILLPRQVVILGSIIFCVVTQVGVSVGKIYLAEEIQTSQGLYSFFNYFPLLRLSEFFLGMAISHPASARIERGEFFIFTSRRGPILAATTCILVLGWNAEGHASVARAVALPLLFATLIYCLTLGGADSVLGTNRMVALGEASYALYIIHVPIGTYFHSVTRRLFGEPEMGRLVTVVYLATVIAVSLVVMQRIEIPARKYLLRAFGGS